MERDREGENKRGKGRQLTCCSVGLGRGRTFKREVRERDCHSLGERKMVEMEKAPGERNREKVQKRDYVLFVAVWAGQAKIFHFGRRLGGL